MSLALILFLFCFRFAASTAMHSLELGFRTILVDDCSRGIDGDDIKKTFEKVRESNGLVVQSNEVHYDQLYIVFLREPFRASL